MGALEIHSATRAALVTRCTNTTPQESFRCDGWGARLRAQGPADRQLNVADVPHRPRSDRRVPSRLQADGPQMAQPPTPGA
jgi:hypothetical protein